jgi:hypothetical protein
MLAQADNRVPIRQGTFDAVGYHLQQGVCRDLVPSGRYGLVVQPLQPGFGVRWQINGKVAIGCGCRFRNRRERHYVTWVMARSAGADGKNSVRACKGMPHRIVQNVMHRETLREVCCRSSMASGVIKQFIPSSRIPDDYITHIGRSVAHGYWKKRARQSARLSCRSRAC